ncbi:hypothetical protein ZWY2020_047566 [Hordeum vulgare]|nr:hypothetical protein ZWY2020_047566 [Hordeum vulgare]
MGFAWTIFDDGGSGAFVASLTGVGPQKPGQRPGRPATNLGVGKFPIPTICKIMAESLLLPLVRGVAGKAADELIETVTRMCGLDDDRRTLERHLLAVECKLANAEEMSETNRYVKSWMKELKSVAYQADDVLDDFQYEALRRQSKIGKSITRKALSYITRHSPLLFRFEMSRKLKNVLKKINKLVEEMNKFGLENSVHREKQQHPCRQTHSKLDDTTQIFGRDNDKEVVVKLLLDQQDQRRVQIFPRLKRMELVWLPSLEMLAANNVGESCDNLVTFPMLEELEIEDCPKLASIAAIPVVSMLSIVGAHSTVVGSVSTSIRLGSWPFLVSLTLGSLEDIPMLPLDAQQSQSERPLEKLESLTLKGPNSLIRSSGLSGPQLMVWKCFRFVRNLTINGCSNLVRWPTEELRCMDRLRVLRITYCDYLEGNTSSSEEETLPGGEHLMIWGCRSVVALPWNLGNLAKLRGLDVMNCRSLKALPDGMCGLTSLRKLEIWGCPVAEEFLQNPEYSKQQHAICTGEILQLHIPLTCKIMAESLLLPLVRGVAGKAADALVETVTRMCGLDDDRQTLERHLLAVECKLANAEEMSETNRYVKSWMKELKSVAYQADDVLDDFQYEALRRESKIGKSTTRKALSYITRHSPLLFRFEMSRKLKSVLKKISKLVEEMNRFGLENSACREKQDHPWRQTHSKLDETTQIFGRADDKKVVVKLLQDQQDQRRVQYRSFTNHQNLGVAELPILLICNIMAESLLLPIVRGVAGKATDALVETVTRMCGLDDDRQTLERHLLAVECKLANAEEMSEKNSYVKRWMKELKSVAYEADDVLDDFQYEALRRESMIGKSTTRKAFSYITRHSPLLFRFEMSRKLKNVLKKINKLVMEMNMFGLESSVRREERQHLWRQTHSKLDETTQIFGRYDDKEKVVKLLLDQQDQRRVQQPHNSRAENEQQYAALSPIWTRSNLVVVEFLLAPTSKIMAESLLLPLVRGVAGKAADELIETVTRMCGLDEDRQTLERHLLAVECKLAHAEEMSETNRYVKSWMKELKSVAYQADDVLDDFQYEALRRESKIGKSTTRKALSYITRHSPLLFRFEMSRKLKNILKKINKLVLEMNTFGLENSARREERQHPWRQTHSKLDDTTQIFGRDNDKEVVVKLLLDQQDQRRVQLQVGIFESLRAMKEANFCPFFGSAQVGREEGSAARPAASSSSPERMPGAALERRWQIWLREQKEQGMHAVGTMDREEAWDGISRGMSSLL